MLYLRSSEPIHLVTGSLCPWPASPLFPRLQAPPAVWDSTGSFPFKLAEGLWSELQVLSVLRQPLGAARVQGGPGRNDSLGGWETHSPQAALAGGRGPPGCSVLEQNMTRLACHPAEAGAKAAPFHREVPRGLERTVTCSRSHGGAGNQTHPGQSLTPHMIAEQGAVTLGGEAVGGRGLWAWAGLEGAGRGCRPVSPRGP